MDFFSKNFSKFFITNMSRLWDADYFIYDARGYLIIFIYDPTNPHKQCDFPTKTPYETSRLGKQKKPTKVNPTKPREFAATPFLHNVHNLQNLHNCAISFCTTMHFANCADFMHNCAKSSTKMHNLHKLQNFTLKCTICTIMNSGTIVQKFTKSAQLCNFIFILQIVQTSCTIVQNPPLKCTICTNCKISH